MQKNRTITIYGGKGVGKTTTAINLATELANKNNLVGIISSNIYYGELQTFLDCTVSENKGLGKALEEGEEINKLFVESSIKNLFVLSMPNNADCMKNIDIDAKFISKIMQVSKSYFDYLIIDGDSYVENPITLIGMNESENVIVLFDGSINSLQWFKSIEDLKKQIHIENKFIYVANEISPYSDGRLVIPQGQINYSAYLSYVKKAKHYENIGVPIINNLNWQSKIYLKGIRNILEKIKERG